MRIPSWAVPLLLRMLSLTSLTSAVGATGTGDLRVAVGLGFGLSVPESPAKSLSGDFPTGLSQPDINNLSLDLDLFLKVGDLELKTTIMPL